MSTNEQKEPWFLEINPNGRIPAITDKWTDGSDIRVFESGAILQYLVDRYDKDHKVSYPRDSKETWEVNSWVRRIIPPLSSPRFSGGSRYCVWLTLCKIASLADGWLGSYAGTGKPFQQYASPFFFFLMSFLSLSI